MNKEKSVTFEKTWNLGDFNSLSASMTIWFSNQDGNKNARVMARNSVVAQHQRELGDKVTIDIPDGLEVDTISVTLSKRVNLGNYEGEKFSVTDWEEVDGDLEKTIRRLWNTAWANINEEVALAKGETLQDW